MITHRIKTKRLQVVFLFFVVYAISKQFVLCAYENWSHQPVLSKCNYRNCTVENKEKSLNYLTTQQNKPEENKYMHTKCDHHCNIRVNT